MLKQIIAGFLLVSVLAGCLKDAEQAPPCNPSSYDTCAIKAPAAEIQAVRDYLTANNITATEHCSGIFYAIDVLGTGTQATVCSNIAVTYQGKLVNGTVFDEAATPVSFGLSGVIPGWKNGIPLIKPGGRIYLFIPPSLGYGSAPYGPIPGNSILIFRVELIAVQ